MTKQFLCNECNKSYAYKANLNKHLKLTCHLQYSVSDFKHFSIESTSEKYNKRFRELKGKTEFMNNLNDSLVVQIECLKEENKKLDLKDRIIKQQFKQINKK